MSARTMEWMNLIVRWAHVIAGIMWIGQTYLFNWMERALTPPDPPKDNISGELWMVHGGGFYLVEKQKWPERAPKTLHWFKWESAATWLTGFLLLMIVYWGGPALLPYDSALPAWAGPALSAGSLLFAWLAYNALWASPLGRSELLGACASWALVVASAWGLSLVLSNRAVYLHVGAMFGTVMVCNVWMRILPNQRKIMALTEAGAAPRPELALAAKRCSKHNTYMSVPLIFTMISSHFPDAAFGGPHALALLALLVPLGWVAAKILRERL